jgi:hypothetical protein
MESRTAETQWEWGSPDLAALILGQSPRSVRAATKKTAVLVAPPKFREETSKKAVRLSATASQRLAFADAACKRYLLQCSIVCRSCLCSVCRLTEREIISHVE